MFDRLWISSLAVINFDKHFFIRHSAITQRPAHVWGDDTPPFWPWMSFVYYLTAATAYYNYKRGHTRPTGRSVIPPVFHQFIHKKFINMQSIVFNNNSLFNGPGVHSLMNNNPLFMGTGLCLLVQQSTGSPAQSQTNDVYLSSASSFTSWRI